MLIVGVVFVLVFLRLLMLLIGRLRLIPPRLLLGLVLGACILFFLRVRLTLIYGALPVRLLLALVFLASILLLL